MFVNIPFYIVELLQWVLLIVKISVGAERKPEKAFKASRPDQVGYDLVTLKNLCYLYLDFCHEQQCTRYDPVYYQCLLHTLEQPGH